jgi:beta-xylosidase
MTLKRLFIFASILAFIAVSQPLNAQNPFVKHIFTADPSARVFNDKVYVFPSHDIRAPKGKGLRENWFCMEDYHVFSSENLTEWTDHGIIVSQYDAAWVDSTSYSMWAPDCIERNGKYYFYYPANTNIVGPHGRKGFGIGVAIADKPEGPYTAEDKPIEGIFGIDPNVLIDTDGQAYIYWSMGQIFVAKLKDNMLELASEPQVIDNLPAKGMKEGPWVFERNGIYYLTFPHVENETERLEYAMGNSPTGPFKMEGVIMDESPTGCWTNHHSIVEYNNQWFLFYHHNDLSPNFDKNRSIRIDSLFFNNDGTIQKVIPTLRGVGITQAQKQIQIDRYSHINKNAKIDFIDSLNPQAGWKTIFNKNAWVQYNAVEFDKIKTATIKAKAPTKCTIEIRLNGIDGELISTFDIDKSTDWNLFDAKAKIKKPGTYNLIVKIKNGEGLEIDYLHFE